MQYFVGVAGTCVLRNSLWERQWSEWRKPFSHYNSLIDVNRISAMADYEIGEFYDIVGMWFV